MALDRQSIEKRDFPISRRGYDPDAVDTHLSELADAVDELKVSSRRHTETLATSAGDQVRTIIEAAEAGAAEIKRQAEEDARATLAEAASDAHATRDGATAQGHEYVRRVSEATAEMLQRLNSMDAELTSLLDTLRGSANRLNADLQVLEGNFAEVRSTARSRGTEVEPSVDGSDATHVIEPAAEAVPSEEDVAAPDAVAADGGDGTLGGENLAEAKLIALNMALNGTSREETERYLSEHFATIDHRQLLDDVYASAG